MYKLIYGLQLCSQVELSDEERKSYYMKRTKIAHNKFLRMMDNCRIRDRKSITEMLVKNEILSVNQVAAQIKLTEACK